MNLYIWRQISEFKYHINAFVVAKTGPKQVISRAMQLN